MGGTNGGRTEENLVEALPLHTCATFLLMCAHVREIFYSFLQSLLSPQLHSQEHELTKCKADLPYSLLLSDNTLEKIPTNKGPPPPQLPL